MDPKFLLWTALLLLAQSLPRAQGIQCYKCASITDPNCVNSPEKAAVVNCKTECIIVMGKDKRSGADIIGRGCPEAIEAQPATLAMYADDVKTKTCKTEKCNVGDGTEGGYTPLAPGGGSPKVGAGDGAGGTGGGGVVTEAASALAAPVCALALSIALTIALALGLD